MAAGALVAARAIIVDNPGRFWVDAAGASEATTDLVTAAAEDFDPTGYVRKLVQCYGRPGRRPAPPPPPPPIRRCREPPSARRADEAAAVGGPLPPGTYLGIDFAFPDRIPNERRTRAEARTRHLMALHGVALFAPPSGGILG